MDARKLGHLVDRTRREFSEEDITQIADTYHRWREGSEYEDVPGFCKSASLEEIQGHNYVLTPGRYVGAAEQEDDGIPFEEKMQGFTAKLSEQFQESARLEEAIRKNLEGLGYGL
ncbi:MAG: SAM-dependent DNA methyltransferase [Synechococcaceae cyanobacterium SM2_3_1]|nr:SAM-dependent DNA methyltransferase [Synechococcaceae cyanobacterium SM2_3_1]